LENKFKDENSKMAIQKRIKLNEGKIFLNDIKKDREFPKFSFKEK